MIHLFILLKNNLVAFVSYELHFILSAIFQ